MNILLMGDKTVVNLFLEGMKEKAFLLTQTPEENLTQVGVKAIYTVPASGAFIYDVDVDMTIASNIINLSRLYSRTSANGIVCAFEESPEQKARFLSTKKFPNMAHGIFNPDSDVGKIELPMLATAVFDSLLEKVKKQKSAVSPTKAKLFDMKEVNCEQLGDRAQAKLR